MSVEYQLQPTLMRIGMRRAKREDTSTAHVVRMKLKTTDIKSAVSKMANLKWPMIPTETSLAVQPYYHRILSSSVTPTELSPRLLVGGSFNERSARTAAALCTAAGTDAATTSSRTTTDSIKAIRYWSIRPRPNHHGLSHSENNLNRGFQRSCLVRFRDGALRFELCAAACSSQS